MKKVLFALLLTLTLTLAACSTEDEVNEFTYPVETYQNATITEVVIDDTEAVMTVVVTGFRGDITVSVTVDDHEVTAFEVIEHEESDNWGRVLIEESTFIQDLVNNTSSLNDVNTSEYIVDAESGATASATGGALLDAAWAALGHYVALYA